MGRYFFRLSYIGTNYRGVQKSIPTPHIKDSDTISGAVENALLTLHPRSFVRPSIYLSSRTDAGVHALSSSGHTDLANAANIPYRGDDVLRQVNRYFTKCGHTIRLLEWHPVEEEFHCRHLVSSRTYLYRLARPKRPEIQKLPIFETNHSFHFRDEKFDVERVKEGLKLFLGKHDFRTFAKENKTGREIKFVRELMSFTLDKGEPLCSYDPLVENYDYWAFTCRARSFLHNQVRRMVGSLLALGAGKIDERDIKIMLTVPSHTNWDPRATPAAPGGLYLKSVHYEPEVLEKYIIKDPQQAEEINKQIP